MWGAQAIFFATAIARERPASTLPPAATAAIAASSSSAISATRPACSTLADPRSSSRSWAMASTLGGGNARVARQMSRLCPIAVFCFHVRPMEDSPFNLFGDPDEFRARMEELSEQMQSSQRVAWADNAIKLAVEMTVASIGRLDLSGSPDEQAMQVRDAIRVLFPESVTLVREAREGLS